MSTPLSVRQLEVFLRVAEGLSFSRASRALHVSQPALTRNIQQTEQILGVRLFDRDSRHVKLSPIGAQLLPIARKVLGEFEAACSEMAYFVGRHSAKMHVAAMPSVAADCFARALPRFLHSHPEIEIKITELRSSLIPSAVAEGACDFGLSVESSDRRTDYKPLFNDDLVLVCRAGDPLARMKWVSWTVFSKRPWIAFALGDSIRAIVDPLFAKLKLDVRPKFECQQPSTVRRLIEEGVGVSVLSSLIFKLIKSDSIVERRLVQPTASRSIGIVTRARQPLHPAAAEFLKTLSGFIPCCEQQIPKAE